MSDEHCDCECCQKWESQIEFLRQTIFDIEDLLTGEYDMAAALAEAERTGGVLERLETLEVDELSVSQLLEAQNDAALPIQQLTAARKAGHMTEENDKNRYRSTFVWSEFHKRAIKEPGALKLTSQQTQNILDGEDFPTNRNTVRRVMEWVAKLSNPDPSVGDASDESNLLQLKKRDNKNVLVADRQEFEELADVQSKQAQDEADDALAKLAQAEVATDD